MLTISSFPRVLGVPVVLLGLTFAPCYGDVPDVVFEIHAVSDQFGASFEVLAEWGDYDPATQTWTWTLPEAVEFWDRGAFLGSLDELDATVAPSVCAPSAARDAPFSSNKSRLAPSLFTLSRPRSFPSSSTKRNSRASTMRGVVVAWALAC